MLYNYSRPNLAQKLKKNIVQICLNSVHQISEKPSALDAVRRLISAICFRGATLESFLFYREGRMRTLEHMKQKISLFYCTETA